MGAAKESRDRKAAHDLFEQEASEPCGLSRRGLSDYTTQAENTIGRLEAQNASLKNDLSKTTQALKKVRVYRAVDMAYIAELKTELDAERKRNMETFRAFKAKKHAHQKLSNIVRFALTPEQYNNARKEITS